MPPRGIGALQLDGACTSTGLQAVATSELQSRLVMPIYRHFYVERLGGNGWGLPKSWVPDQKMFAPELGQFAWVHPRKGWLEIFFGEHALLPFHEGTPKDWGESPLLHHLRDVHSYDFEANRDGLAWIPFSELLLDEWQTETVLIGYTVDARWAQYFGDGNSPLPSDLLSHPDFDADLVSRGRGRLWKGDPISIYGRNHYRLAQLAPDTPFQVTCRETIADFVGARYALELAALRDHGRDQELRILSLRG